MGESSKGRSLRAEKIIDTCAQLEQRIDDRFPGSGLRIVAGEVLKIARDAMVRSERMQRPNWPLRLGVYVILFAAIFVLGKSASALRFSKELTELATFVSVVEATLGSLVFLGAGAVFLVTLEMRIKRDRALAAIHELRALAHIVDMHQLTKDPDMVLSNRPRTRSSPTRSLTPFELGRYLDYCDELLSMLSKIAALYVQHFPDSAAMAAVDQVETLTSGLSRKIWQKIMILDRAMPALAKTTEMMSPSDSSTGAP